MIGDVCMNMWVNTYDWKCMYVCCGLLHMIGYVCMLLGWFTYAREVCICCISIHGESYAHALLVRSGGSGLRGVVAGVDPPDSYRVLLSSIRGCGSGPWGVIAGVDPP